MNARRNCLFLATLGLLMARVALVSGEPLVNVGPLGRPYTGPGADDPDRFWVSSVVMMTGTPVAFITDTARSGSWFAWGNAPVDRYQLGEVTPEHVILIERGTGKELRLRVGVRTASVDAGTAEPALFTKEWMNSRANPMFGHPVTPPRELYGDWPTATEAEKAEFPKFYEKYGWQLVRAEVIAGAVDFAWEWAFEGERVAAAQASREAFRKLLSPAQRETWERIQANGTIIYAVNGKFTPEQEQVIAERRQISAEFRSGLTEEQKAAFEDMHRRGSVAQRRPDDKRPLILPRLAATDPATTTGPAPYTRAWINSKANPMLLHCEQLSGELNDRWATLSAAERTQVVEYYQKHGWQLLQIETVSGHTGSMAWRNIYEQERTAVLKARRETFVNLLSPEQRQAWRTGPVSQTIYIKDGNPDYARNRNRPEQQKFFNPFWAGLDARQRAAYEGMHDFTLADWN